VRVRRLIFLSVTIALILAGVAASSSVARPEGARPAILCPLSGPTCCGPPHAGPASAHSSAVAEPAVCCAGAQPICCEQCCTGAQPACCTGTCAPELTIAASPNPSRAGRPVSISGRATGIAAGTKVVLWQRLPGQRTYHSIKQTTSSSSGGYAFAFPAGSVDTNRDWYVTAGSATSATIAEGVHAIVKLSALSADGRSALRVRAIGRVVPAHAGERLLLQRRLGRTWRTIARSRMGRGSRFDVAHRFATAGRVELRVVLPATAFNLRSTSGRFAARLS
jgi:hypothetical protein